MNRMFLHARLLAVAVCGVVLWGCGDGNQPATRNNDDHWYFSAADADDDGDVRYDNVRLSKSVRNGDSCYVVSGNTGARAERIVLPSLVTVGEGTYRLEGVKWWGLRQCGFAEVVLPHTLEVIEDEAFAESEYLREIVVPEGCTELGKEAFDYCTALERVELPDGINALQSRLFHHCKSLADVKLPATLQEIGNEVFYNCSSLRSIELPASLRTVGERAFADCSSLESIVFQPGVTSIAPAAFHYCESLRSIELPEGLTSLEEELLDYCTSLAEVTIPSTVTSIGRDAFGYCPRLSTVRCRATVPPEFAEHAFRSVAADAVLVVPRGTAVAYVAMGYAEVFSSITEE